MYVLFVQNMKKTMEGKSKQQSYRLSLFMELLFIGILIAVLFLWVFFVMIFFVQDSILGGAAISGNSIAHFVGALVRFAIPYSIIIVSYWYAQHITNRFTRSPKEGIRLITIATIILPVLVLLIIASRSYFLVHEMFSLNISMMIMVGIATVTICVAPAAYNIVKSYQENIGDSKKKKSMSTDTMDYICATHYHHKEKMPWSVEPHIATIVGFIALIYIYITTALQLVPDFFTSVSGLDTGSLKYQLFIAPREIAEFMWLLITSVFIAPYSVIFSMNLSGTLLVILGLICVVSTIIFVLRPTQAIQDHFPWFQFVVVIYIASIVFAVPVYVPRVDWNVSMNYLSYHSEKEQFGSFFRYARYMNSDYGQIDYALTREANEVVVLQALGELQETGTIKKYSIASSGNGFITEYFMDEFASQQILKESHHQLFDSTIPSIRWDEGFTCVDSAIDMAKHPLQCQAVTYNGKKIFTTPVPYYIPSILMINNGTHALLHMYESRYDIDHIFIIELP